MMLFHLTEARAKWEIKHISLFVWKMTLAFGEKSAKNFSEMKNCRWSTSSTSIKRRYKWSLKSRLVRVPPCGWVSATKFSGEVCATTICREFCTTTICGEVTAETLCSELSATMSERNAEILLELLTATDLLGKVVPNEVVQRNL